MANQFEQDVTSGQSGSGVANAGVIRPPVVYLGSIGLGLIVHWIWPAPLLPVSFSIPAGTTLVLVAGALFIASTRTFRKSGTPVPGNRPTSTVVREGPYAFSRNPIYLAFSLFQAGLAAWINSVGMLLTLLPAVAMIALVVIPREERYLESRFPAEYPPYKRTVRRWL